MKRKYRMTNWHQDSPSLVLVVFNYCHQAKGLKGKIICTAIGFCSYSSVGMAQGHIPSSILGDNVNPQRNEPSSSGDRTPL